jgi:hypothetical protein
MSMGARVPTSTSSPLQVTQVARTARLLLALGLAAGLSGCTALGVEPWVKPYERNQLADPIMSWGRDPISSSFMGHVRQAREGARGAEGGAGGGCGCN